MGYALAMGHCIHCQVPFAFNPIRVPSIRVNGKREPVCEACAKRINEFRASHGLDTWDIAPDAYEGVAEEELPFDD
jgi:hypothetical protein